MSHYKPYPVYKDSGVEWVGKVPAHWNVLPLKYLLKSMSGGQATKNTVSSEPLDGHYPAFSASGQDIWIPEFEFDTSGIVLSAVGARCGKTFKADGRWGVVANTHCLFPRLEADRDYFWYLTNREEWWEKGGTAQPFVKVSETLDRKHCFPPKDEQVQISRALDLEIFRIDALISKKTRFIELLREKRQALITHAVTKGLDPSVKMKESGVEWLGDVPAHWEVKPLKLLVKPGAAITYGIVQPGEPLEDGVPFVQTTNMTSGDFSLESLQRTSQEIAGQYSRTELQGGEVLLGIRASIGAAYIAPMNLKGANISRGVARILCEDCLLPEFLVSFLSSWTASSYWDFSKQGSTFNEVSIATVKELPVVLPPIKEQLEVVSSLSGAKSRVESVIKKTARSIELLKERRSALITAAVTGQIDLREAA